MEGHIRHLEFRVKEAEEQQRKAELRKNDALAEAERLRNMLKVQAQNLLAQEQEHALQVEKLVSTYSFLERQHQGIPLAGSSSFQGTFSAMASSSLSTNLHASRSPSHRQTQPTPGFFDDS